MPPDQSSPWPSAAHPLEQPRAAAAHKHRKKHVVGLRPRARTATPHSRQGDRGDDDGDDGITVLPIYCRYADLVAAKITANWPHLLRLIDDEGFPVGIMLSRNVRAWEVDLVRRWLSSRPTTRKIVPPAKRPRRRKQQAEAATEANTST